MRFDGKVAIVTGAGGALGSAYVFELASRGAFVLVNDLGTSTDGKANDTKVADEIVGKIRRLGGRAEADYHSVMDGDKIVQHAIDAFGRVDILVNNAGILRDKSFHKMTDDAWKDVMDVHLNGTFKITKAAFMQMREQKYGRIVMVSSGAGLYGNFGQANYASAKAAVIGLMKVLSKEGQDHHIAVNTVVPIATSRMTSALFSPDIAKKLGPEKVAPLVTVLCHESCSTNGSTFEVGGSWFCQTRVQRSSGVLMADRFTAEDILEKIHATNNFPNVQGCSPESLTESMKSML